MAWEDGKRADLPGIDFASIDLSALTIAQSADGDAVELVLPDAAAAVLGMTLEHGVNSEPSLSRRFRRIGTRAERTDRRMYAAEAGGWHVEIPPTSPPDAPLVIAERLTGAAAVATYQRLALEAPSELDRLAAVLTTHAPGFARLSEDERRDMLTALIGYVLQLRTLREASAAETARDAVTLLLVAATILYLLTQHARRASADDFTRLVTSLEANDRPPPPTLEALTTSTLTAAPPALARPVPGARRAVLVTAG